MGVQGQLFPDELPSQYGVHFNTTMHNDLNATLKAFMEM